MKVMIGEKEYPYKLCCWSRVREKRHKGSCLFFREYLWDKPVYRFGRKQNFTWREYFESLNLDGPFRNEEERVQKMRDSVPHECDVIQRLSESYRNLLTNGQKVV